MLVQGYGAAILTAEMSIPSVRPGGKKIERFKKVYWEQATEEMKKDSKRVWFTSHLGPNARKFTFLKPTKEEEEEMRLNEEWRKREILRFIFENFGPEYADKYAEENKMDKLIEPHCRVDGQCTLSCPFFKNKCNYQEAEKNVDNL